MTDNCLFSNFISNSRDLIEIYGEPQTSYDLSYKFSISRDEVGEQFTVKVTVVDVGGRETSQDVLITMDGDFENPVFSLAPDKAITVLMKADRNPQYTLNFTVTDDRKLDYATIEIPELTGFETRTVSAEGQSSLTFKEVIVFPNVSRVYTINLAAYDAVGNSVTTTCSLTVSEMPDFEKMYLADVATDEELNSDVFGVPMVINHTGEYQYKARYYNKAAGTEIFFLPQKTSFTPICFGLDPEDSNKLTDDPELAKPIVLDTPNVYYEIDINVKQSTYSIKTYSVTEATDPINYEYGQLCDMPRNEGEPQFNFYIGWGDSPQNAGEHLFVQDANNPHLFYYPATGSTWSLQSGEEMNFIISNYHPNGYWDQVEWRCDNSTDIEKFGYFSKANNVNPNWEGTNRQWWDGSSVQDNWMKPVVTNGGNYRFEFDAHLGRGKIVPAN